VIVILLTQKIIKAFKQYFLQFLIDS